MIPTRFCACACVTLALALCACPSPTPAADRLRVWFVFNLPPAPSGSPEPPWDEFLEGWAREGVEMFGLREKGKDDADFRRRLRGQVPFIEQLSLFRRQRPGFPAIEVAFFGWDEYWESVRSAAAGRRPDVMQVPTSWCSSLAGDLGLLAPLPEATRQDALRQYEPGLIAPCLVDGEPPLFGLPWTVDARVLFFWREDLPSLERELRNNRSARDAFRASLQSAAPNVDHPLFALPTARDWELLHQLALLVWGQRGDLIESRRILLYRSRSAMFKEPALRGAEFVRGLLRDHLIELPRETRQQLERKFLDHELGSVISGPWLISQLQHHDAALSARVGIALPPFYESTPVTFVGGSVLGITGREPALRTQSLELAKFLAAGPGSLPSATAAGLIPASREARGTAAAALARRAALERGVHCATYFECTLGRTDAAVLETIEDALRVGRTYPSIPDWWKLEVPSRLGSLYHFWQESAALQPSEVLDGNLQVVSDEWNSSLQRISKWTLATGAGAVLVIAVFIVAGRYRQQLRHRESEILRHIQSLAVQHELQLEGSAKASLEEVLEWLIRDLAEVQRQKRVFRPYESKQEHFHIVLPSRTSTRFTITGSSGNSGEIAPMVARLLERLMRRSLLEQQPVTFSLVEAAFWCWHEGGLPQNARGRLEMLVSDLRNAFRPLDRRKVVGTGKNTVYRFQLDESWYTCFTRPMAPDAPGDSRFDTTVRTPYLEAKRLSHENPRRALGLALQAFHAQHHLLMKDLEVLLLICHLAKQTSIELTESQQKLLADARLELSKVHQAFGVFFAIYGSTETLLQGSGESRRRSDDGVIEHWDALRTLRDCVEEAAAGSSADDSLPPTGISAEWHKIRLLITTLGVEKARHHEDFAENFGQILDYWKRLAPTTVFTELTAFAEKLDPNGHRKNRFASWMQQSLATVILAAIESGEGASHTFLKSKLEQLLHSDIRDAVRGGLSHPVLETASGGDIHRERRLLALILDEEFPADIHRLLQSLESLALQDRQQSGPQTTG